MFYGIKRKHDLKSTEMWNVINPVDPDDPRNGTRRSGGSDRLPRLKAAIQIDPIWQTP